MFLIFKLQNLLCKVEFWENICSGHKVDFKNNLNFNSLFSQILHIENNIYLKKKSRRYIRIFEMNWLVHYTFLYYEHMTPFFPLEALKRTLKNLKHKAAKISIKSIFLICIAFILLFLKSLYADHMTVFWNMLVLSYIT